MMGRLLPFRRRGTPKTVPPPDAPPSSTTRSVSDDSSGLTPRASLPPPAPPDAPPSSTIRSVSYDSSGLTPRASLPPPAPVDDGSSRTSDLRQHVLVPGRAEGDDVYGRGYAFKDHDHEWSPPATLLCRVAGVTVGDRPEVLQSAAFAPLEPVLLSLEFDNPHDSNAIAVMTADGTRQVGYVEREVAAVVAKMFRRGTSLGGMVLFEWRRRDDDRRCGLRLLLAPVGDVQLRVEEEVEDDS
jgi:hypothetical protein